MSCSLDYPCSSTQVSMIVCIGAKMHYEHKNFTVDNNNSSNQWFSLVHVFRCINRSSCLGSSLLVFITSILFKSIYFLDLLDSVIRRSKEQGAQSTVEMELSSEKIEIVQYIKSILSTSISLC